MGLLIQFDLLYDIQLRRDRNSGCSFATFFGLEAFDASIAGCGMGFFGRILLDGGQLSSRFFLQQPRLLVIKELIVENLDEVIAFIFNLVPDRPIISIRSVLPL